jgi:HlyD family secretion protein
VLRDAGEIAGPSAPVISFLPDGAVKLKLYVGESQFSSVQPGVKLAVNCDGCPTVSPPRSAMSRPIPEFTPPVIYSLENRQKLVFLVEARPDAGSERLQPGQIVDVRLAQ